MFFHQFCFVTISVYVSSILHVDVLTPHVLELTCICFLLDLFSQEGFLVSSLYLSLGHSFPCYTGLTNTSLNRIPSLTDHYQNLPLNCFKMSQHTIFLVWYMAWISCYSFLILTTVSPFLMHLSYTSPPFNYVPSVRYCKHIV